MIRGIRPSVGAVWLALVPAAAAAADYGQAGQTFPVIETDLLAAIAGRLRGLAANGGIARANADFARAAEAKVRRPTPVAGLTPAVAARSWMFDPSITLDHAVRDQQGNVFGRAGQLINPLDFVTMRTALVFLDGDDERQIAWATRTYAPLDAKLILVAGSPIDAMTRWRRRFYFDQQGRLVAKFRITHTPAVAVQAGKALKLSEIVLEKGSGR